MPQTKLYLDTRAIKDGNAAQIKLSLVKNSKTILIGLGIKVLPEQWDKDGAKVVQHPKRNQINAFITRKRLDADDVIMNLIEKREYASMGTKELKAVIERALNGERSNEDDEQITFSSYFIKFAEQKGESTKNLYMQTYRRMEAFDDNFKLKAFEDITKEWLNKFDAFMAKTSPSQNARNIHLRNIRAVFNNAIDDEITNAYPFRKFKIKPVETVKRALSVEQIREVFNTKADDYAVKYLDLFKLAFFFIGINTVDLCRLKEITQDNRIEFYRAKTKRLYSIKVEPEAMEIINKYRGDNYLLDILDKDDNYINFSHAFNRALHRLGEVKRVGRGGKKVINSVYPKLTTYWARHTWATIAVNDLNAPYDIVSKALGHSGTTGAAVTSVYVDFDNKKVDRLNRAVIDWVLYGKRTPFL